jgi:DNA-binding beta-propeller fold protein YncE
MMCDKLNVKKGGIVMKRCAALLLALIFTVTIVTPVLADAPFQGYNYNFWGGMVPAPVSHTPLRSFGLHDIDPDLGVMSEPTDLHVDPQNNIFIVDSGNHRIIVFDHELNLNRVLDGFYRNGEWETFNRPTGVFVTQEMELFITDTQNNRIVILDENDNFSREISSPDSDILADDFIFLPLHVVVDRGGRAFVIAGREFEGIMSFNSNGDFIGFFGTISVGFNPIEMFWRFFMTQEQRSRQRLFIPTEFQGMDIDDYGFIFTTNIERWARANQVMRLNPRGQNVITNFNDNVRLSGDQSFRGAGRLAGPSVLIDIAAMSHGMYAALDSTRGRVFVYDQEGNVLYVIGGQGTLQGMSRRPVSVVVFEDDFLVLDADGRGRVIQFTPTEYGALINTAIRARYDGDQATAVAAWRRLVEIDENFALAWSGIGRTALAQGDNVQAMYYLRRGMDMRYYSVAFRRNRLDVMQETLPGVLTGAMILAGVLVAVKIALRFRKKGAAPS